MNVPPPPPPPLPASALPQSLHINPAQQRRTEPLAGSKSAELVEAIQNGDKISAELLFASGADINQNSLHGTPLSVAVRTGNLDMVKLVLSQKGCLINASADWETHLTRKMTKKSSKFIVLQSFQALLSRVLVYDSNYDGETAICLALRKDLREVALYLIARGCQLNRLDPVTNSPPLTLAVKAMDLEIINAILAAGADVDQKDHQNFTPLAHAALLPEPSRVPEKRQIMQVLIANRANVSVRLGPPYTGTLLHKVILERCAEAVAVLLEHDKVTSAKLPANRRVLPVNQPSAVDKNTPLHLAVAVCDKRVVEMLMRHGVNVNAVNVFCDTPLSKALKDQLYDMSEIIKLLLEHGADPNFEAPLSPHAQRKGPCRPVFAAIENGRRDYLDLLLDYGADLSLPDVKGFCPVMPCLANGISIGLLRYVVNLMEKKGVRYNISSWPYLKMAFQWQGHMQFLIDHGLDVNASNPGGPLSILHTNAVKWYSGSLEVALQNDLDPDVRNDVGQTMLCMCAGIPEYWPAVRLLVQYGADINHRFEEGGQVYTPVQRAFVEEFTSDEGMNNPSQFRYLVNCGAQPTNRDVLTEILKAKETLYTLTAEEEGDDSDSDGDSVESTRHKQQLVTELERLCSPLPLSMCCRSVIRMTIIQYGRKAEIMNRIDQLPLPSDVKKFLRFEDVPHDKLIR